MARRLFVISSGGSDPRAAVLVSQSRTIPNDDQADQLTAKEIASFVMRTTNARTQGYLVKLLLKRVKRP